MGSIGRRWKPRKGRSRAVLIARTACARAALPPGRGAHGTFVRVSPRRCPLPKSSMFSLASETCPFFYVNNISAGTGAARRSRWPWRRGPPLSIPNREVKPASADGTAREGGRVGRRLTSKGPRDSRDLFFWSILKIEGTSRNIQELADQKEWGNPPLKKFSVLNVFTDRRICIRSDSQFSTPLPAVTPAPL